MANEEHVELLKRGIAFWNSWRRNCPRVRPNFEGTDFSSFKGLADIDNEDGLAGSIGGETEFEFRGANLSGANLRSTNFGAAVLQEANLSGADFCEANLVGANLCYANIKSARLSGANLTEATLLDANLQNAYLGGTNLRAVNLRNTDFSQSILYETVLGDIDLTNAIGLDRCNHRGPSIVDHRTFHCSKNVPLSFWRGCGLPDSLIDYMPSLLGEAIQFFSCFISYSSKDQEFAERLHADLQNAGVRCWFAPHDMRTGDRIRDVIDVQIRVHEKLLLVLSESSVASDWVEDEVEAAIEKEQGRKDVLFPVRIDDAIEDTGIAWARKIKRARHITNFSGWKDHDAYKVAFGRLLRDLKVER